jgi:hypothetical protein
MDKQDRRSTLMQRLPIGIQDFAKIREDNYCYVDKTALIHRMLTSSGSTIFLSRPRRFGKSLLCSTLAALFEARRELFTGLAIDSLDWQWEKHPVVRIDLNAGNYENGREALLDRIETLLMRCSGQNQVIIKGNDIASLFENLIIELYLKYNERVVVIIDEYDKPLLSTIDIPDIHKQLRAELKGFYGVLKSADEYLRFSFLTGVTKFSQVSIFSDLNQLDDISLESRYADLCGITQEELETFFPEEIEEYSAANGLSPKEYLQQLRSFYNGYRFSEKPLTVYNPFGLLHHFNKEGKFIPYWYESGTPTFLLKLIEAQHIDLLDIEDETVSYADFSKFDIETMRAVPVLYQSGYLTITDYDAENFLYTLGYPNTEVRSAFSKSLLEHFISPTYREVGSLCTTLPKALRAGDLDTAMERLTIFLSSVPYDIQIKKEKYYQTVIHIIFNMLGLTLRSEVRTSSGRIDALVETPKYVYCFEFKLKTDKQSPTAKEALAQIKDKEYLTPWQGSGKKLIQVGVVFDYEKRNIGEWVRE